MSRREGSWRGLLYAGLCYVTFLGGFAYFVLFLDNLVPQGIDAGTVRAWPVALAINLGLVLLWGLQHSVMARKRFKAWWTRVIPAHTERATYCLASTLALLGVCLGWSPMEGVIWQIDAEPLRVALHGLAAGSWILLLAASFEIDHFELFGLKQSWYAWRGLPIPETRFQTKRIYRWVRHPIQTGVFFGMWAAPTMTASRFSFALMMTVYILIGLYFEERDLVRQFGERYRDYMRRVPKLIPRPPSSARLAGEVQRT